MPKKTVGEIWLRLPKPPSAAPIVDTHTHLASTFEAYRQRYKACKYETVFDFVRGLYGDRNVESIIDVWCEAPVRSLWREFSNSAHDDRWGGIKYWFVMGESTGWEPISKVADRLAGAHPWVVASWNIPIRSQTTQPRGKTLHRWNRSWNVRLLSIWYSFVQSFLSVSKPCPIPVVSVGEKWASTTTTTCPRVTFNSPSSVVNSGSP